MGYLPEAIYTLKDDHYTYKGQFYPSIKKLYIEMEDTTEYEFANKYFLSWKHWLRLCDNKAIQREIEEWRAELEYKLRARGIKSLIIQANSGNFQAAKWLADRGWEGRGAGRPSEADKKKYAAQDKRIADEFAEDYRRLTVVG